MIKLQKVFDKKILPAVNFDNQKKALKVAQAILNGGLNVMEVPLRTDESLEAIKRVRSELPEMYIGAGTILTVPQLHQAKESGAQFGLAPGFNPSVVKAAAELNFPFIPGVMTPSEIESALEFSCFILKLFPVEQLGGVTMLNALEGPYGHTGVKFLPMGGISPLNMASYLSQKNIVAVGGSWIADKELIASESYQEIESRSLEAVRISEGKSRTFTT